VSHPWRLLYRWTRVSHPWRLQCGLKTEGVLRVGHPQTAAKAARQGCLTLGVCSAV